MGEQGYAQDDAYFHTFRNIVLEHDQRFEEGLAPLGDASVIRHNTLLDYGLCDYSLNCGVVYVGSKLGDPSSSGTQITDNILSQICTCEGTLEGFWFDHNLLTNADFQLVGGDASELLALLY